MFRSVDPEVIVMDSNERTKQLMMMWPSETLKFIVITSENIHPDTLACAKTRNVKLYPFTEVEVWTKLPKQNDLTIAHYRDLDRFTTLPFV